MMEIGLILSDIDGTLLKKGAKLSQKAKDVLERLKRKGYYLVPVTARSPSEVYHFCVINRACTIDSEGFWGIVEIGGGLMLPSSVQNVIRDKTIAYGRCVILPLSLNIHSFFSYVKLLVDLHCKKSYDIFPKNTPPTSKTFDIEHENGVESFMSNSRWFDLLLKLPDNCKSVVVGNLMKNGLTVIEGAKYIHVGYHLSKGRALDILLNLVKRAGFYIKETICMGDSPYDLDFIKLCTHKFTVNFSPKDAGYVMLRTNPEDSLNILTRYLEI